jgi:hypothetical protein
MTRTWLKLGAATAVCIGFIALGHHLSKTAA